MDADALRRLAAQLSRPEFVACHTGLYLILAERPEALGSQFSTDVVSVDEMRDDAGAGRLEVKVVAKAPGNPYPDRISVGRARNCDIVLREPSVSKLHAHFLRLPGGLELSDFGSQNGTRVNGGVLPPQTPRPVRSGDRLSFGTVETKLVDGADLYDLL
jgi:hypothetical protein